MKHTNVFYCILLPFTIVFALEPARANLEPEPKLRGDEKLQSAKIIPYFGGRQSPGDIIGTTAYDYQANGGFGQRLMVDDYENTHINWMKMDTAQSARYCAWNARQFDGTFYGETQASDSWSGYVQLDVTRDPSPDSQRTVICYHFNPGSGYYSWIDIDAGNLSGSWPHDPKSPEINDYIWPTIAVASNNNILMATGDYDAPIRLHLLLTTDQGNTWTSIADMDSCARLTHFLRASRIPGSQKVVMVWTQWISDTIASGTLDQNVWFTMSFDNGVTWGSRVNVTDYQPYPQDSARAYADVNAVFDHNDNLHIVWAGRRVTDNYWQSSKIFHWDEISDTITIVSSPSIFYNDPGGWWITVTGAGDPGAYHMPACEAQLVVDTITGWLYCLWQGNDDYYDYSAAGYFNGELYASYSTDNGITWQDYINLTNTRSPGAAPGECMDEDYYTACPYIVNDSIYITYVEDKDAGAYVHTEGTLTENPVRYWVFHRNMITGIAEEESRLPQYITPVLRIHPNPFSEQTGIKFQALPTSGRESSQSGTNSKSQVTMNIYDTTGHLVKDFSLSTAYYLVPTTIQWSGRDQLDRLVPAGVYFVRLESEDCTLTKKVVKLK
jgi:hypothetical protein